MTDFRSQREIDRARLRRLIENTSVVLAAGFLFGTALIALAGDLGSCGAC